MARRPHIHELTGFLLLLLTVASPTIMHGRSATPAPSLPVQAGTVVDVATETELQAAVQQLASNTTIVLAPGTYQLTTTLYVKGALANVTLRGGTDDPDDVVLLGHGMANDADRSVPYAIWTGGGVRGVTIANLTIRDTYDSAIIFDKGTQSPRVYNVHLVDAGRQFIKSSPDGLGGGADDGRVEYSVIEYTTTAKSSDTGGVDVQSGARWTVRHNLFRNIVAPPGDLAGPALLMWNGSSATITEGNTFLNCAIGIAYGLADQAGTFDHRGGIIRNNVIYRSSAQPGGVGIGVADSPDTEVLNNTVYLSGTFSTPIEYRFAGTTGVLLANNLLDGFLWARDGATGTELGNLTGADDTMFANAAAGDLHLTASATAAIDHGTAQAHVTDDWDGEQRPASAAQDIGADEYVASDARARTTTSKSIDTLAAGAASPLAAAAAVTVAPIIDATAFGDQTGAVLTVSTSGFSTTAGSELVLAFVSADGGLTPTTVTGVAGAGLTWQLVRRTNAQGGTAEIWRAFAASALSAVSVTATFSQATPSSITVVSFKGVDASGTNGSGAIGATGSGNANPGAPTASLTTTRDNAWVFGAGNDWDAATARTIGPSQTMVHQHLAGAHTFWAQRMSAATALSGTSVTINDTAPSNHRYNLTIVEILPMLAALDTTPPTVAITAPAAGATVAGAAVAVTATASDDVGVVGVQFKVDGANLGAEDLASPYSVAWSTTAAANGTHTLTAVARDAAGNTTTSAARTVTVNNTDVTAPAVSMTAPASGATVSGTAVTVSATATDSVGVVGVQFKLDGANLGAEDLASPYSVAWSTTATANGTHTLTAVARDAAGNTRTSAARTVTVNNTDTTAPAVSMTAPASGATVSGTAVAVSATATDTVGVVGVQFKLDGANLGAEDLASPYSVAWSTTASANGTHTLTAVARDAAGNITTSAARTVTVSNTDTTPPAVTVTGPAGGAVVSGAALAVSATASDNVAVLGVQFLLDGIALGAEDTSAPYSTTWNTTTTANGAHSLTARARDGAGNLTTSPSVSVTVTNTTSSTAPVIDALVSVDSAAGAPSVSTPAFSTTAGNELLVAFVSADGGTAATTVTGVAGAGLTWQLVRRTNVQGGTSEIWRAFAAAPLSAVSVTATFSVSTPSSLTVVSFRGVDASGTNGSGAIGATGSGNANPGVPTAALTTTRNNAWVFGVGNDWDAATARTIGPNQTMIHETASIAHTFWVQRMSNPTALAGTSVTVNDVAPSADRFNLTIVEILPSASSDGAAPTVSITAPASGATVSGAAVTVSATASDNVGVAGVQFRLDGANLGGEDTASPYTQAWSTTTVANGAHTLTAVARDAAGNTTTSAAVTVTVNNAGDTTAPAVSIAAPGGGSTVSGASVTISATASDSVGVVGVQFKVDGVNLGAEDMAAAYSQTWNTTTAANGTHTLTAVARDAAGNTTTSSVITVTVSNTTTTPPTSIVFQASTTHSLVTSYLLEVFASGANPDTATPVASSDLGKGTPAANGDITVNRATFFASLAPGLYEMTVSSLGPGGPARSAAITVSR